MNSRVTFYLVCGGACWINASLISNVPRFTAVLFGVASAGFMLAALLRHIRDQG